MDPIAVSSALITIEFIKKMDASVNGPDGLDEAAMNEYLEYYDGLMQLVDGPMRLITGFITVLAKMRSLLEEKDMDFMEELGKLEAEVRSQDI